MRRIAATAALALLAAVLYGSLFASLPDPLPAVNLPLILILAFIVTFRFPEAVTAAITGGLTLDLLSAGVFGANTVVFTLVALLLFPLFTRVFTNRSIPGFIGINVAAFLLLSGIRLLSRTLRFWLAAYPVADLFDTTRIPLFLAGLATHIAVAMVLFAFTSIGRRTLSSVVMMR